jgi:CBS domain-containing protein
MTIGTICTRLPETTTRSETVRRAAEQMAAQDVGSLIVTDDAGRPEGIVTDRDVVIRCVAEGLSPDDMLVADVMTAGVSAVREDTSVEVGLERMANDEIRRLAVVDDADKVVGIVTLDDILGGIIEQTEDVGRLLREQVRA